MEGTTALHERRTSGRVHARGTAVVHGVIASHARLFDLSTGGLSLVVDSKTTLPSAGALVHLDLRLDGVGRWLHLSGIVVRVETQGPHFLLVVALVVVPTDFEDLVQAEILSELECARQPRLLLVDAARGRRELVADALRALGCLVIEASSPLEAIAQIDQSRLHLWAVVVADTKLASQAEELRRFLAETHPEVRQIFNVADVQQRLGHRA